MNTQWKKYKLIRHCRIIGNILLVMVMLALTVGSPTGVFAEKIVRVGLVFDPGGPLDHSINELSYQALLQAEKKLHVIASYYRSDEIADIEDQIRNCAAVGNQLCLSVGFLSQDYASTVAAEYPEVSFAIIDGIGDETLSNLRSIDFDYRQVGYLAGVLAGKMTSTDKLGVVAGWDIPPVVNFAEGFQNGAQCTNLAAEVMIEFIWNFWDPDVGASAAEDMVDLGADVIYGVAGLAGNGAIRWAANEDAWVVGVDYDQYLPDFLGYPYADRLLTSTMKNWDVTVYSTVEDFVKGSFTPGIKVYGLETEGVGLAPFHEAASHIPAEVAKLVEKVEKEILAGMIDLYDDCR